MNSKIYGYREEQLERKLNLLLGTGTDWLKVYAMWCADNDVSDTDGHEDHNIKIFVKQQQNAKLIVEIDAAVTKARRRA